MAAVSEYSMSVIGIGTAVNTARRYSPKEYYRNSLRYVVCTYGVIYWTIGILILVLERSCRTFSYLVLEHGLSSFPPAGR